MLPQKPDHAMRARRGATLIDVAAGSMLLAVLLIPSIHLIGEAQRSHTRLENAEIMLYEAEQLIETTRVALSEPDVFQAALTNPVDVSRPITASDGPELIGRVRVTADPTLPTSPIVSITADVWQDHDRDGRLDDNEPNRSLRTQWALQTQ